MRSSIPDFCWLENGSSGYSTSIESCYFTYKTGYNKFAIIKFVAEDVTLEFKAPI